MSAECLDTTVGARLWYRGAAWTVDELDGSNALLHAGDQFKKVYAPSLVGTEPRRCPIRPGLSS